MICRSNAAEPAVAPSLTPSPSCPPPPPGAYCGPPPGQQGPYSYGPPPPPPPPQGSVEYRYDPASGRYYVYPHGQAGR